VVIAAVAGGSKCFETGEAAGGDGCWCSPDESETREVVGERDPAELPGVPAARVENARSRWPKRSRPRSRSLPLLFIDFRTHPPRGRRRRRWREKDTLDARVGRPEPPSLHWTPVPPLVLLSVILPAPTSFVRPSSHPARIFCLARSSGRRPPTAVHISSSQHRLAAAVPNRVSSGRCAATRRSSATTAQYLYTCSTPAFPQCHPETRTVTMSGQGTAQPAVMSASTTFHMTFFTPRSLVRCRAPLITAACRAELKT
jgi:hypothetical protein